jgi:transcriptional regulator with XRE-family HTH domain
MSFGQRLVDLRATLGLSQRECAARLGMETSKYNKWENDKNRPDYETLVIIANFFDVTIDYLLGRSENKKTEYDAVSNRLGLDNDAIETLEQMAKMTSRVTNPDFFLTLNYILKTAIPIPIVYAEEGKSEYIRKEKHFARIRTENPSVDVLSRIDSYFNFEFSDNHALAFATIEKQMGIEELPPMDSSAITDWRDLLEQKHISNIIDNLKLARKHFQEQKGRNE